MWKLFSQEEDTDKRASLAPMCIQMHNMLSSMKEEYRLEFLNSGENLVKRCLLVIRAFLAIGQLVHETFDVFWDRLDIKVIGNEKKPEQIFDVKNFFFLDSIPNGKEDSNEDAKTAVDVEEKEHQATIASYP